MPTALKRTLFEYRFLILRVSLLNVVLTLLSEIISRLLLGGFDQELFFYSLESGLNRQSMISVLSSFFITIIGSPTWYVSCARRRYLLFVGLGAAVSALGQYITYMILDGKGHLNLLRLSFDMFYLLSFKYLFFEWKRRLIASPDTPMFKMIRARIKQDSASAVLKNFLLAAIGLKN